MTNAQFLLKKYSPIILTGVSMVTFSYWESWICTLYP